MTVEYRSAYQLKRDIESLEIMKRSAGDNLQEIHDSIMLDIMGNPTQEYPEYDKAAWQYSVICKDLAEATIRLKEIELESARVSLRIHQEMINSYNDKYKRYPSPDDDGRWDNIRSISR